MTFSSRQIHRKCSSSITVEGLGLVLALCVIGQTASNQSPKTYIGPLNGLPPRFAVIDLGAGNSGDFVNNDGQVVLNANPQSAMPPPAMLWTEGTTTPIADSTGTYVITGIAGMNNSGVVAVSAYNSVIDPYNNAGSAFAWTSSGTLIQQPFTLTELDSVSSYAGSGLPPRNNSFARGIDGYGNFIRDEGIDLLEGGGGDYADYVVALMWAGYSGSSQLGDVVTVLNVSGSGAWSLTGTQQLMHPFAFNDNGMVLAYAAHYKIYSDDLFTQIVPMEGEEPGLLEPPTTNVVISGPIITPLPGAAALNQTNQIVGNSTVDGTMVVWDGNNGYASTPIPGDPSGPNTWQPKAINVRTATVQTGTNVVTAPSPQIISTFLLWEQDPISKKWSKPSTLSQLVNPQSGWSNVWANAINDKGAIVGTATLTTTVGGTTTTASHGVMLLEVNLSCPIADTTTTFSAGYGPIASDINPAHFFQANPPDPTLSGSKEPALVIFYKDAINTSFVVQPFTVSLSFSELSGVTWAQTAGPTGTGAGTLQNASHTDAQYVNPTLGGLYQFDGTIGTSATKIRTSLILPLAGAEVKDVVSADMTKADTFATNVLAKYNPLEINWPSNGLKWFNNGGAGDYLGRPDNASSKTCVRFNSVNDSNGMGAVCTWFGVPIRLAKVSNYLVGYASGKIGVWNISSWLAQGIGTRNDASATASYYYGSAVAAGTKTYSTDTVTMLQANFYNADVKNTRLWPNTTAADNHVSGSTISNFNTQFCSPGFTEMTSP